MTLRSFGCSFIFGSDLADDGRGGFYATPSKHTWPALLAAHLNLDYKCHARPGIGNLQILEKLLTQSAADTDSLCVIGWTWIDRFDFNNRQNDTWQTLMPIHNDPVTHSYYRDLHSQYRDKLTSLIYIKTAIDTLQQKNIRFVMTIMDDLLFETSCHSCPAIEDLQEYIKPHIKSFDGQTFLDWSRDQGFEISKALHPLEAAHFAAAEYAKDYNFV
jgi:hypothetical protein